MTKGIAMYSAERLGLIREVEDLLYREAELADTHAYDEWLGLWTNDVLYWVPCNNDDIDPMKQVSLIYDDRERLEERLFRLKTKHAHSQNPRSRLIRTVSNVCLHEFDAATGGTVTSRFVLGEVRLERQTEWIGRMKHVLVRADGALRIREKRVFLVNNDIPMGNLTFVI
ncbi:MAG: aromatic-ring-hydroxylating dioxygenase subunit beta [Burkholderiales bacterium]